MSIHDKNTQTNDFEEVPPITQFPSPDNRISEIPLQVPSQYSKPDQQKSQTPFQQSMRRLLRDKRAVISLSIILFFILLTIVGPPIYQHIGTPYTNDAGQQVGPEVYHNPFRHDLDFEDHQFRHVIGSAQTRWELTYLRV